VNREQEGLERPVLRAPAIKLTLLVSAFAAAFALIFVQSFRPLGYLFTNVDALLFFSSFHAARHFGSIADLQTFAFGQGFGAFQHPALFNLFWWLFDWTASVQLAYLITEFLVFVSIFAFAYFASNSVLASGVAAFFATSFFFVPALFVDHFGTAVPQAILQIAFAYLGLAAIGFGLRSHVWMIAGFAILLYAIITDWMYFIFIVPFVGMCLLAFALNASINAERKEMPGARAWLFTGTAVIIGLVYTSEIPEAYDSFTLMSLRAWSPGGLLPEYPRSLLIWGGVTHQPLAIVVGIAAILAMIYLTWLRARFFVFVCPAVLAFLAVLAVADIDSTGANIYWTLPAIGYFERPLIPFYAIVIACALTQLARRSSAGLREIANGTSALEALRPGAVTLVLVASGAAATIVVFAWIAISGKDLPGLIYRPPYYWERTAEFVKELPVSRASNASFAPYFVDLTEQQLVDNCPHLYDPAVPPRGRYCGYMLNLCSARNFFEPHNLSDLQTFQMFAATVEIGRRASRPARANPGIGGREDVAALKSFGVRYVALDGSHDGALAVRDLEGSTVSLLDLGLIEADDMSVRSVEFARLYDPEAVIAARSRRRAAVHDERLYRRIGTLVPASDFSLEYRPGAVAVTARSVGESIILLPFQFSHCLRLSQNAGASAELIRVNGGQAALHFVSRADAHIVNTLTYFGDSCCRKRDFADVFRLGIWPVASMTSPRAAACHC
jgi:hypothetical protein